MILSRLFWIVSDKSETCAGLHEDQDCTVYMRASYITTPKGLQLDKTCPQDCNLVARFK